MKTLTTFLLLLAISATVVAQTGTYRLNNKGGASCTIAVTRNKDLISAEVFAWWNTKSGRNGSFTGEGLLKNNSCILESPDDADCRISLKFTPIDLLVNFRNCMAGNLLGDFSGHYQKITNRLPGNYSVVVPKAYFYKSPESNPLKTYLIKGNQISIDLENITNGQWVFVNFTNPAGKLTSGYMQWSALRK